MEAYEFQELQNICSLFYSSSEEQTRKIAETKLTLFFNNPENLSFVYLILSGVYSNELKFLSIKSILNHLPDKWKTFNFNSKFSLFKEIFSMVFSSNPDVPSYILCGMCKILAVIYRLGSTESAAYSNFLIEAKNEMHSNRQLILYVIKFYQELINEITQPSYYRTGHAKLKVLKSFQENILKNIVSFSVELLQNFINLQENELENLLDLVCLTFSIFSCCSFSEDLMENENSVWTSFIFEGLKFAENFLFAEYTFSDTVEAKTIILLENIGKAKIQLPQRGLFIDVYLKLTSHIFSYKPVQADSLISYIQALKSFFENVSLKEVSKNQNFESWILGLYEYSISLFTSADSIISQYSSSLFLWNYLSSESHVISLSNISLTITSLFKPFVSSTLSNVSNELILQNIDSIKDQLDLISNFSLYFSAEFLSTITEFYPVYLADWAHTRDTLLQGKLSWIVLLSSSFLICKSTNSSQDNNSFIVQQVLYIIQNVSYNEISLILSCIIYLNNYTKCWVNVAEDNLSGSDDNEYLSESSLSVLEKITVFIFKQMQFNSHSVVVKNTLELFEYLAKGHFSSKVLLQVSTIQDFSYNYINYPICLNDSKLRSKVFHILSTIWQHDQNTEGLDSLLAPYEQAIRNNKPEFFEFLFREIQGICSAIHGKSEFFSWFIERIDFFLVACSELFMQEKTISAFLKMVHEVTDSRGNRIIFQESSAKGVIMFKKISPLISNYSKFISENYRQVVNYLGKSKRIIGILKNFLAGGYVCFGVFQVFNDDCFVNSINSVFLIMSKFSYSEITVYSKLLDNIYDYFGKLLKYHSALVIYYCSCDFIYILLEYVQKGISSANLKYCISSADILNSICEEIVKQLENAFDGQRFALVLKNIEKKMLGILETLIETIVIEDTNYMWSLSKPLLGLIILSEGYFGEISSSVITKLDADSSFKEELKICVSNLMMGVERNMKDKNKEIFAKNFSLLRNLISSR